MPCFRLQVGMALLAFGLCSAGPSAQSTPAHVAVVTHPDVPVADLTLPELRKILLGDRQFWQSGAPITLVVRAPVAAERNVMLERIYRMSEAQYRQYWIAKVFRAESATGPKVVLSPTMTVELVRAISGSVALLEAGAVPDDLKVLRIDGLLPGETGYALR